MSIKVISKSSKEREDEIKELFEQMKPYLLEGKSYSRALCLVKNTKTTYTHTRWFKDLVEYGESQGFPRDNFTYSDRYGLLNVHRIKDKNSLTGYYWIYRYYDKGNLKRIFDNDLHNLKVKVEDKGLEWKITNSFKASKSFEENREMQLHKRPSRKKNKGKKSKSGVKHVTTYTKRTAKNGFYWCYRYEDKFVQSSLLKDLKSKVEAKGWDWIVFDEALYNKLLKEEKLNLKED